MTKNDRAGPFAPRYSIALLAGVALGYEVLLMRLFSIVQWHHFAYMIISLAMLGYGISGTVLALTRMAQLRHFRVVYPACIGLFALAVPVAFLLAQRVPFNAEEVLWDARQPLHLLAIYLLLAVPFLLAANAIGLAFARFPAQVPRVYAADLLGAGAGSVGIIALLYVVFPATALQVLSAFAFLALALAMWELDRHLPARGVRAHLNVAAGLALALAAFAVPHAWLALEISPYKGLSQTLRVAGTQIVEQRSSPLGLLTVVASDAIPLRHAPGLSLLATGEPPPQLAVFTDGDGMTVINGVAGSDASPAYLDRVPSALPYHLARPQRVLVLGAGGGSEVLQAHLHGVPRIDAVELNPDLVALVRDTHAAFAGDPYDAAGVDVHVTEARGYVATGGERYDLIQLTLVDSFGAAAAGLGALNESYLYTVEAFTQYLRHLAPDGYLVVTRWIQLPPRDLLKLFATAIDALAALGVHDAGARLALIRGWQTGTLLIKNGTLTGDELDALRRFCTDNAFDTAWHPGLTAPDANRYNRLREDWFHQGARALLGPQRADFERDYKFDIHPATDDRPYFFQFFKWDSLPELLELRGRGGMPLIETGYLVLVATLAQALLASAVLILLPLWWLRRNARTQASKPGAARVLMYFSALGLGFMLMEIAFLQKFILFLHHPLYAAAVVLAGFLVFAGLGSAWSQRVTPRILWPVVGIAVLGVSYLALLGPLFRQLMPLPDAARVAVSILLIAPLAFCMGMPFPLGLTRVGAHAPALLPWAWGVNGFMSVIGAVLATLIAIHFGFGVVVWLAVGMYGVAALAFPTPRPAKWSHGSP